MTLTEARDYNKSVDVLNMPSRIRRLPVSPTGYPVPWFVAWFANGKPSEDGVGLPDFRVVDPKKIRDAVKQNRCWVCGQTKSAAFHAFVIGSMCAINRCISEPSSHRDCAIWSAKNCPFLSRPNMVRNEKNLQAKTVEAAGVTLKRNPGVVCVWVTKHFKPFTPPGGGILFSLGVPVEVIWIAQGKIATRQQIMDSIDAEDGYPKLEEMARLEGPAAMRALATQREWTMQIIPDR
jgi:hypothetical protein